jgi:hypothetical protein
MKALFRTNKYIVLVVGIVSGLAVAAYAQHREKTSKGVGKVEIKEEAIVLHPGTELEPADAAAMDSALARHSKKLYKITTVENGKITRKGDLSDGYMTEAFRAEVADAERKGTAHRHHQVYCTPCVEHLVPGSEETKIIEDLKPILAKYQ